MLNKVILQGRLVADPELRRTQSGTAVLSFRIACDRDYKSKDQGAQNVDFINVVAWRNTAEFISRYFTKGSMILVDGRLQVRDYTDRENNRRTIAEVVVDNVHFAASKRESGGSGNPYPSAGNYGGYTGQPAAPSYAAPEAYAPSGMGQAPANEFAELSDDDGELPF